jgi:hypothetical protein
VEARTGRDSIGLAGPVSDQTGSTGGSESFEAKLRNNSTMRRAGEVGVTLRCFVVALAASSDLHVILALISHVWSMVFGWNAGSIERCCSSTYRTSDVEIKKQDPSQRTSYVMQFSR